MKEFNLDTHKNILRQYVALGDYYNEIRSVLNDAAEHIDNYIGNPDICIILDIDQTAIDQYPLMLKYDFGWFESDLDEANIITDFPSISPTLDFYHHMLDNYVDVIFLTSRRQKYDLETKMLLANCGYTNYTRLITRPNDDTGTIQDFKIRMRKYLVENPYGDSYNIIANIGDQQSDLDGGYPDVSCQFKLPNPFYLITSEM